MLGDEGGTLNCFEDENTGKCCDSWTGAYCERKAGDPACTAWKDNAVWWENDDDNNIDHFTVLGFVAGAAANEKVYVTIPTCNHNPHPN